MNKLIYILTLVSLAVISCNTSNETKKGEEAVASDSSANYVVDSNSTLNWKGSKITGDFHTGTISISEGSIAVEAGKITAGTFTVDMKSINITDIKDSAKASDLRNHLANADFFKSDSFPTSTFTITKVNGDSISGNLTILGKTNEITILAKTTFEGDKLTTSSTFSIDRTKWNIVYGSSNFFKSLGNKAINDTIEFSLNLSATKK